MNLEELVALFGITTGEYEEQEKIARDEKIPCADPIV